MFSLGLLKDDECDVIPLGELGPRLDYSIQTIFTEQGIFTFNLIYCLSMPHCQNLLAGHIAMSGKSNTWLTLTAVKKFPKNKLDLLTVS